MSSWFERAGVVVLAVVTALVFGARAGSAQLVDEESVGRLTIGFGIGVLVPSMTQVDRNINVVNPFLVREEVRELDLVSRAMLTGMDIRYRLGNTPKEDPEEAVSLIDRLSVGFTWGAINAGSEFDVTRARVRFYSRTTTYTPYILYHLPFLDASVPRAQLLVGGGPVFLRNGVVQWTLDDRTHNDFFTNINNNVGDLFELAGEGEAKANGLGFALQGGGTFMLNGRFSVGVDLGYRYAKLSNLEINTAVGQARFLGTAQEKVRRPGDWAIIDFFRRDPYAEFEGRLRTDDQNPQDPEAGGCGDNPDTPEYDPCPQYYKGDPLEVDYSGPFANISFRAHF